MICPNCQHENREGSRFCSKCSQPLPQEPRPFLSAATRQLDISGTKALADQPHSNTRPLTGSRGMVQRPMGAIFAGRFQMLSIEMIGSDEIHYIVRERGKVSQRKIRKCSNPDCGFVDVEGNDYCVACGKMMQSEPARLRLIESLQPIRPELAAVIALTPVHSAIRPPLLAFDEKIGGVVRHCMVIPETQELPNLKERAQVGAWTVGLASALDVLFDLGMSCNSALRESAIGLDGTQAAWTNFKGWQYHEQPVPAEVRARSLRQFALMVYTWLSNKSDFSGADPSLAAPLSKFFTKALLGEGYISGADLAEGLNQALVELAAMRPVAYQVGRLTDVGRTRHLNEDSLFALDLTRTKVSVNQPLGVFVVADGMGGHAAGEVASAQIVDFIGLKAAAEFGTEAGITGGKDWLAWLKQVVDDTNRSLLDMRREMGTDMGSTLVMAIMDGSKAYLAHVGDSRAYRINADGIEALTTDHSMVARLVASGVIKPEEVRSHPQRNIVYRTMGDKAALEIDVAEHTLQPGDRLLLCSDGLWEMVVEADLQKIVMEASSPQQACQKLVEVANAHGGVDNITVIIIEVELS